MKGIKNNTEGSYYVQFSIARIGAYFIFIVQ